MVEYTELKEQESIESETKVKDKGTVNQTMNFFVIFCLLSICHLISALYNNITDCDETFNFWEPTHFLTYNTGFQTWEYSPEYSLRSYTTLLPELFFGKLFNYIFDGDKIKVFYAIRCLISLLCSYCEMNFIRGISKIFNNTVAVFSTIFFCFSVGQYISSSAYLNSSIAMISVLYSYGEWFLGHNFKSLFVGSIGVVLGWPFSGLAYIPVGLHSLYKYGILKVIKWFICIVFLVAIPDIMINYYFYHQITFPCLHILLYNVFKVGGGSELYGVEPWSFYFKNLLLNMNVCSILSFMYPMILIVNLLRTVPYKDYSVLKQLQYYVIFYVFVIIFFNQEHKEERFLFIIYPFIYLTASLTLYYVIEFMMSLSKKIHSTLSTVVNVCVPIGIVTVFGVFILLSTSRILAYINYFHAPLDVYSNLYYKQLKGTLTKPVQPLNICLGKEWHRFPASYFIPFNDVYKTQYIQSGFTGILPKQYSRVNGTFIIPTGMNTMNQQEMDRYIDVSECDYIIDLHLDNQVEPQYETLPEFHVVYKKRYLDIENTKHWIRSFYIPLNKYLSQLKWLDYMIIKNDKKQTLIHDTVSIPVNSNNKEDTIINEDDTLILKSETLYEGHEHYFNDEL